MQTIKSIKADLENKKIIFREIGLIVALLIVFFAFNIKSFQTGFVEIDFGQEIELMDEIVPITVQETKPPPPPVPSQTIAITIVDNDVEEAEDIEFNAEVTQETEVEVYIPFVPIEQEEEEIIDEEQVFVVVESMPEFPGGNETLMKYLHKSIKYPALAKESNIQGKVFVSFVIEKDGSVTDVKILRGIGGGCDEEAIRVVQEMPPWIPGSQRNVPVRVLFNLPIRFTLK